MQYHRVPMQHQYGNREPVGTSMETALSFETGCPSWLCNGRHEPMSPRRGESRVTAARGCRTCCPPGPSGVWLPDAQGPNAQGPQAHRRLSRAHGMAAIERSPRRPWNLRSRWGCRTMTLVDLGSSRRRCEVDVGSIRGASWFDRSGSIWGLSTRSSRWARHPRSPGSALVSFRATEPGGSAGCL